MNESWRKILELQLVSYIRIFFGHCHVTFPYKEPLSFFGRFVQKLKVTCFQIHLFRNWPNSQMAAVMLQVIPSVYTNYSQNSLFISAKTYEKINVSNDYCIVRHDDKMCFLTIFRYHIIPIGNIKGLLWKLDEFCSDYQHVDCLYTLFNYPFSGKIGFKKAEFFDNVQRAVHFNHQNRGGDRITSIAKKRLLKKKYKKNFFSFFQKTKLTPTGGSVFADKIPQVKETKFELEPIKIVDCFLDGQGNYTRNLVCFFRKKILVN